MRAGKPAEENEILLHTFVESRNYLVACANRIVKCPSDAEDIVQDVALRLCAAGQSDPVLNPKGYLCQMVRNLAIDVVRRNARVAEKTADEAGIEHFPASGSCPLRQMESAESLAAIWAALAAQPPRMCKAFIRHRIYGVPQKELAAEIGVSPTLVNFMIRDAALICRRALDQLDVSKALPISGPAWPSHPDAMRRLRKNRKVSRAAVLMTSGGNR